MISAEEIKRREREAYDAIAEEFDSRIARYNAQFAKDLIDLLFPQKGDVALDLAGGTGAAGITLAESIGGEGSVTIIDISPGMLQQAAKNAAGRMLTNVHTRVMDAENLEFPDSTFDIIVCSQAVMAFPNIEQALMEVRRVLKPGGRLGFTVWSVPERFPLFFEPAAALLKRTAPFSVRMLLRIPIVGMLMRNRLMLSPGPLGYSPSRFCAPGSLENELTRAGFHGVRRDLKAYPIDFETFEDYWETIMTTTPPVLTRNVPREIIAAVREELRKKLVDPKTGSIRLYNEAAYILARKPV